MTVVKMNAIEVLEGAGEELERRFAARQSSLEGQPGFLSFELLRPVSGETRYFVVTRWESDEDFRNWMAGPGRERHSRKPRKRVSTGSSVLAFEVVESLGR